jgi:hypothetical protein
MATSFHLRPGTRTFQRTGDRHEWVRWCQGAFWAWVLSFGLWAGLAAQPASKEDQLKAAFIYNFTKFIEWPADRFPAAETPLVIGVLGQNTVRDELQGIAKTHRFNGRPIEIKAVQTAEEAATVHLLFVGAGADHEATHILKGLQSQAVLTVGETDTFTAANGMITFLREGDKVRFAINMPAAERAGFHVSAHLRKLALPLQKKP